MSAYEQVPTAPPDPIFGITKLFQDDTDPNKANLGVGAYRDEDLQPYVLGSVKEAERRILNDPKIDKEYLPIDGLPEFVKLSQKLLFGENCLALEANKIITVQSVSGTGALRVCAEFISKFIKDATILIPDPTWANHAQIFGNYQNPIKKYQYFDQTTKGLAFGAMCSDINSAPNRSVLIVHACAHNPTGVDPTPEQWKELLKLCQEKDLFVLFDTAYQGYASGDLEVDAYSIRLFVDSGLECFVAQSYAKNFGLYGERAGTLSIVLKNPAVQSAVLSQVKVIIRGMYSNPPLHGALIVATVLGDKELTLQWKRELKSMADRIIRVRQELLDAIIELKTPGDWSHILKQIGMFTFTGLSSQQSEKMVKKHHIYMTSNGRISMTGLNSKNISYVARAINDVVTESESKL